MQVETYFLCFFISLLLSSLSPFAALAQRLSLCLLLFLGLSHCVLELLPLLYASLSLTYFFLYR